MKVTQDFAGGIRDMRNRKFPLQGALLELIDNSVDEGASNVDIRLDGADLIIEDDGNGFKNIESALRIGESFKSGKIGRYGVGLKHTCARYSNTTTIESQGCRVSVPWAEMATGRHDGDLGDPQKIQDDGKTRVILEDFRSCYSGAILTDDIRRTYQPLITRGVLMITVTGTKQDPLALPSFTETIESEIEFDGRTAKISGGIFPPNDPARSTWKGYHPYYNDRLIGNGKITSMGNDCGCTNFAFIIQLTDNGKPWALATNKDDVSDIDELLEYIYHAYTREIMQRGCEIAQDIELRDIEEKVNQLLNTGTAGNITRSPRTNKQPAKEESKEGKPKRNTNTATTDGHYSTRLGGTKGRIKFLFSHLGGETMGEVQNNGKAGFAVIANLDNPFIEENKTNEPLIQFFAKLAHATYKAIENHDTCPDDLTAAIFNKAGEQVAFNLAKSTISP
jgi:hypothetical protein